MTATTTIVGNTTADPELRYTANGLAVVNFTVASTDKVFDKQTNEWKDGKKLFMRCSAWRDMAEQIASSITKGMRVVVVGKISTREYETTGGEKRTTIELEVDEIGPSLRYATASVSRAQSGAVRPPQPVAASADTWAGGGFGDSDSTPF